MEQEMEIWVDVEVVGTQIADAYQGARSLVERRCGKGWAISDVKSPQELTAEFAPNDRVEQYGTDTIIKLQGRFCVVPSTSDPEEADNATS